MEEVDFVCSTKEINQKVFTDEKQVISLKRKHDMVLSLNKPNLFPSDETPTPTRFIRNCEAIGLFQDLQNVNPFDETFKKATEAVKKGEIIQTLNISTFGKAAGEDLHTPHIDLTSEVQSSNDEIDDVETVIRTEADTSLKSTHTPPLSSHFRTEDIRDKPNTSDPDLRLFVRMPDGSLVQIPTIGSHLGSSQPQDVSTPRTIIISTQNTQSEVASKSTLTPKPNIPKPLLSSSPASDSVRQKLKATLLKTAKSPCTFQQITSNSTLLNSSKRFENPSSEARKDKKVSSTTVEGDNERKLKTLERNRIAAMKCREKRKQFVADLREKYEKMCRTNDALMKEVTFLRNEVVRLKSALLLACNHPLPVQDVTATTVQIVPVAKNEKPLPKILQASNSPPSAEITQMSTSGRSARGNLRLDIEGAAKITVMDLDSPLLVRSDEILTSAAPPTTPNEKLISFPELDRMDGEVVEEKMLSSVIQVNPNALSKLPSAFS